MASDNKSLGRFILDGIIPAPRGMPQIEVSFDIDANGIVSVRAQDKGSGREQKITIQASSGLSKDEVEKMQREADQFAQDDAKRREEVETRNSGDALAYQAERMLRDNAEKVPADLKSEVEGKIAAVRSALQGGTVDTIKSATEALTESMQKVGQHVYQQAGAETNGQGPDGQQGQPKEGTVEGEYREV